MKLSFYQNGEAYRGANLGWGKDQESAFRLIKFEMFVRHPGDVEAFGVWRLGKK